MCGILKDVQASDQSVSLRLYHLLVACVGTILVMHYLGQYIMVKQLYDKQQQHIVHCGTDELGELLGITTFSVKDPSPLYEMLKKNLYRISYSDAEQSPSRDHVQEAGKLDQEKSFDEGIFISESQDACDSTTGVAYSSLKRPVIEGEFTVLFVTRLTFLVFVVLKPC
ncbi:Mdm4 [Pelobates cultripes]|uniref:Mdm4 n=1 Tax=Pelobates cultripes TaxID=61616 RepID=A0AAD1RMA8_PELCU|nr:Mdm4 [Pelobates cultripes]